MLFICPLCFKAYFSVQRNRTKLCILMQRWMNEKLMFSISIKVKLRIQCTLAWLTDCFEWIWGLNAFMAKNTHLKLHHQQSSSYLKLLVKIDTDMDKKRSPKIDASVPAKTSGMTCKKDRQQALRVSTYREKTNNFLRPHSWQFRDCHEWRGIGKNARPHLACPALRWQSLPPFHNLCFTTTGNPQMARKQHTRHWTRNEIDLWHLLIISGLPVQAKSKSRDYQLIFISGSATEGTTDG